MRLSASKEVDALRRSVGTRLKRKRPTDLLTQDALFVSGQPVKHFFVLERLEDAMPLLLPSSVLKFIRDMILNYHSSAIR